MSDSTAYLPKYFALAETLRQQIQNGDFAAGDQITSEPALCEQHSLSRGTVRQAIQVLVDEGVLVREQGRGTFVASPAGRSTHFSLSSFADDMRRQNRTPGTQLIESALWDAKPKAATKLQIAVGTQVFYVQRLRLADGKPVAIETRYLAKALCPALVEEDLANASLHWLLVEKYQVPLVKMEHVVEVLPVTAKVANHLQIAPDSNAFHIDRLTYTLDAAGNKIPAVWYQAVYTQDHYQIQTTTL